MTDSTTPLENTSPIALVTGASAGLGFVIAKTFLQNGYHVVMVGRSSERLRDSVARLDSEGANTTPIACDLLDKDAVADLAQSLRDRFGRLDVLVNNVGESDRGLVSELDSEHLRSIFDRNVVTTLQTTQALLPMLEQTRGSIVNISSLAGKVGARYLGAYIAAKHALSGLTQQMRLEWIDKGIHVAIVSPGPIRREDSGSRYSERAGGSLPEQASKPGGGTRVKGLAPERVARAVLQCAQRKKMDVILPGYLRCLIAVGNASPRLGDWLLLKFTS